jgi:predicted TIM-barrel fold metal-dependent hydrolase
MPSLVDFHTHFFSRAFFEVLAAQSPLPGTNAERLAQVARIARIEIPQTGLDAHLTRWLSELDRHGVAHMVSFASVPEEAGVLAEAAALAGGRIGAFAALDARVDGAAARARELLGPQGFRGLVLFPALHRYRIDGPEARAVLAAVEERAAIAVVHCGLFHVPLRDRFGLPRAHDVALADPLFLIPSANEFRQARFVIPHFGAGLFRETLMAGAQCANLFVDTSSSNSWLTTQGARMTLADVFERVLGVFGPERVLFGTDSSTFPRGWRHDLFLAQREALGACGVSARDQQHIFADNAANLLGLPA